MGPRTPIPMHGGRFGIRVRWTVGLWIPEVYFAESRGEIYARTRTVYPQRYHYDRPRLRPCVSLSACLSVPGPAQGGAGRRPHAQRSPVGVASWNPGFRLRRWAQHGPAGALCVHVRVKDAGSIGLAAFTSRPPQLPLPLHAIRPTRTIVRLRLPCGRARGSLGELSQLGPLVLGA